jgi:hypothetical protein
MDPNGRLYQTGVGTIHPRQQTNALNQYINGCSNSTVAGFVRDDDNNKRNHQNTFMSTELSAFSSW